VLNGFLVQGLSQLELLDLHDNRIQDIHDSAFQVSPA
jgi:Leucine-rich repeat (LRR) protein